jgi:medium-chain acyl-[acyl-carrier-protein] hydrolase
VSAHPAERWLVPIRSAATAEPRLRLLCLAYAGGSPELFRTWAGSVAADVELLALLLPGHGRRVTQQPYQDWDTLAREAFDGVRGVLAEPHVLYGHSFGARLAYELALLNQDKHPGATRRLLLSGSRSPGFPQHEPYLHEFDEDRFVAAVRAMGGTPDEVLDDPEMRRLLLPAVYGEIRLAELWTDRHDGARTAAPITAIVGREDPIDTAAAMRGWLAYSGPGGELVEVDGGHFFPDTHRAGLLEVINERI